MTKEKYIPNYYEEEEQRDRAYQEKCRTALKRYAMLQYFTQYGCCIDGIWINLTGGTNVVEMKHRAKRALKYLHESGIFIEPEKYDKLMDLYENHDCLPFYINTFEGCDYFYLWVLPAISKDRIEVVTTNVPNPLIKGGREDVERYILKECDAYVFNFDGTAQAAPECKQLPVKKPARHDVDWTRPITNQTLKNL